MLLPLKSDSDFRTRDFYPRLNVFCVFWALFNLCFAKWKSAKSWSCANDCRFDYEYYVRNTENDELVRFSGKEIYARNPDNGVMMRLEEEEEQGHIFNSKDLNLAEHIPTILECGAIDSLKIEGRTKSAYYAGITAFAYRAALDDYAKGAFVEQKYTQELDTLKIVALAMATLSTALMRS